MKMLAFARLFTALILTLAEFASARAATITTCVDTASKLQDALNAAGVGGVNQDNDNVINIVRGLYTFDDGAYRYEAPLSQTTTNTLTIQGGYNGDCSSHVNDAGLTILDGSGATRVFDIDANNNAVVIRRMTIRNGSSDFAGGMKIQTIDGDVAVDSNIFLGNHIVPGGISTSALFVEIDGVGTASLSNNLIAGNVGNICVAMEFLGSNAGNNANITNNTVSDNLDDSGNDYAGMSLSNQASQLAYITNNIFWNNQGANDSADLIVVGQAVQTYNDYTPSPYQPPSGSGNTTLDPQFIENGDYELVQNSPLLGAGTLTPPGGMATVDLKGHPRTYNGTVDMGAYERGDEIFSNGFQ